MPMRINADFSERVALDTKGMPWVPSPAPGVERRMLDRIGEEVARATSLVRYAPNSTFPPHTHGGGEEYLVLEGTFHDEHGAYPAGSYVRNPIGTSHAPFTEEGCIIFVKLHQFDKSDDRQFAVDTRATAFEPGGTDGLGVLPLHRFGDEVVDMLRLAPGAHLPKTDYPKGVEFLVLEGDMTDADGVYRAGTWLRLPPGAAHGLRSQGGALAYRKAGHLTP